MNKKFVCIRNMEDVCMYHHYLSTYYEIWGKEYHDSYDFDNVHNVDTLIESIINNINNSPLDVVVLKCIGKPRSKVLSYIINHTGIERKYLIEIDSPHPINLQLEGARRYSIIMNIPEFNDTYEYLHDKKNITHLHFELENDYSLSTIADIFTILTDFKASNNNVHIILSRTEDKFNNHPDERGALLHRLVQLFETYSELDATLMSRCTILSNTITYVGGQKNITI